MWACVADVIAQLFAARADSREVTAAIIAAVGVGVVAGWTLHLLERRRADRALAEKVATLGAGAERAEIRATVVEAFADPRRTLEERAASVVSALRRSTPARCAALVAPWMVTAEGIPGPTIAAARAAIANGRPLEDAARMLVADCPERITLRLEKDGAVLGVLAVGSDTDDLWQSQALEAAASGLAGELGAQLARSMARTVPWSPSELDVA